MNWIKHNVKPHSKEKGITVCTQCEKRFSLPRNYSEYSGPLFYRNDYNAQITPPNEYKLC